VLGAGAVRGLAHVGVLEELERAGFQIHEMLGASVGALIAGAHPGTGLDIGVAVGSHHTRRAAEASK